MKTSVYKCNVYTPIEWFRWIRAYIGFLIFSVAQEKKLNLLITMYFSDMGPSFIVKFENKKTVRLGTYVYLLNKNRHYCKYYIM